MFRPLIGTDKLEIIAEAERLGSFEISSQDAPDCCTLFMPRAPETHAKLPVVLKAESSLLSNAGWTKSSTQPRFATTPALHTEARRGLDELLARTKVQERRFAAHPIRHIGCSFGPRNGVGVEREGRIGFMLGIRRITPLPM